MKEDPKIQEVREEVYATMQATSAACRARAARHHEDFLHWRSRLTDEEYAAITDWIRAHLDAHEWIDSTWPPGNEAVVQPLDVIYFKACEMDWQQSALFWSMIVWECLEQYRAYWFTPKVQEGDRER